MYCVICLALLAWAASNAKAETPKDAGPTITVENVTFPAYPEGYKELEAQIKEIGDKIQILQKEEIQAGNQDQQVSKPIEDLLPEIPRDNLKNSLRENPDLKADDVKYLCPDDVSSKTFTKFVDSLKEIVKLEDQLSDLKEELSTIAVGHIMTIAEKTIVSKHPDYNTFSAKFPSGDLNSALSDLYEAIKPYYKGVYDDKEAFFTDSKETVWGSRPCALNSEPAQIALKFWTAFMRGNYAEAEKYASRESAELIKEAKSNPENRKGFPIKPDFEGTVFFSSVLEPSETAENDKEAMLFAIYPGKIGNVDIGTRITLSQLNQDKEQKGAALIFTFKDENGTWKVAGCK